jgi:iron complex transport system substrate-binding protein
MSFLNEVIKNVEDEVLRETLQERVDLVLHKIKFMEKIHVICLNSQNQLNTRLKDLVEAAGGIMQIDPLEAQVLIYEEAGKSMLELMGIVPGLLQKEWPSVTYNRVYLLDEHEVASMDAQSLVAAMEDMAELLYPGYFVFGNEGRTWTAFGV